MKLAVLPVLAGLAALPAFAKDETVFSAWYLLERGGKAAATIHETVTKNAKDKSTTLKQAWKNFGDTPSTVNLETISVDDKALTPSWMESHFKSKDGKKSFKLRVVAKMNGKFRDAEVTVERLKPKVEESKTT